MEELLEKYFIEDKTIVEIVDVIYSIKMRIRILNEYKNTIPKIPETLNKNYKNLCKDLNDFLIYKDNI